jgi:hypothetical protein
VGKIGPEKPGRLKDHLQQLEAIGCKMQDTGCKMLDAGYWM